jgi:hypothetical protein
MPFEHPKALQFYTYVKRHYRIPDENVYCVGDETDQYYGGLWKKDPNALHTATQEITDTIERLKPWYDIFPKMKLATSNHGTRWMRKALEMDIPELLMRRYESVLGAPDSWLWKKQWLIKSKFPQLVEHGDRFGGRMPHLQAAEANGINTIIGHHHSIIGVEFSQTRRSIEGFESEAGYPRVWGMATGCTIDFHKYAFNYAQSAKKVPVIGCGLSFDDGRIPLALPFE